MTNQPPTITSSPVTTAKEDQLDRYDVQATDPHTGNTLAYTLEIAPPRSRPRSASCHPLDTRLLMGSTYAACPVRRRRHDSMNVHVSRANTTATAGAIGIR